MYFHIGANGKALLRNETLIETENIHKKSMIRPGSKILKEDIFRRRPAFLQLQFWSLHMPVTMVTDDPTFFGVFSK